MVLVLDLGSSREVCNPLTLGMMGSRYLVFEARAGAEAEVVTSSLLTFRGGPCSGSGGEATERDKLGFFALRILFLSVFNFWADSERRSGWESSSDSATLLTSWKL